MRRLLPCLGAAVLIAAALFSSDARAGATVDLLFVGRNGGAIAPTASVGALPGDTLTMAVRMRNDEPLLIGIFSLNYDLDGDNELDVVSAFEWSGVAINKQATAFFFPLSNFFEPATATFVGSFQGSTNDFSLPFTTLPPAAGAFAGGYQMGTVTWKVNAGINDDGADIISGLLNFGVDFFIDATNNYMDGSADPPIPNRVQFNAATVNIHEPGAAVLLGLGLLGLGLLRRRGS